MLVSGGVDSTVAFTLLNEVLGHHRVQGLLIDTGFMRKNEVQNIHEAFQRLGITNLHIVDASEEFFAKLRDVYDPEEKRHIIGNTFLAVQQRVCEEMGLSMNSAEAISYKLKAISWLLGQGTIYPDTIEAGGTAHADTIKTHHNRVPAIQAMIEKGLVVEPLKELYKDEVRTLGEELGLPHELVWRHPFPGPGLAVRILCAKEPSPLPGEQRFGVKSDLYKFRVLPLKSVGVQGDSRTYRHALVVFMERTFSDLRSLYGLATSITNTQPEINRVLLCTSHRKPVPFAFTPISLTRERVRLLQEADAIVRHDLDEGGFLANIWQCPVVLLPIGEKLNMQSIVLRPVESQEAMTASAAQLPADFLERLTEKLLALPGIDMVFLDLTNKPPATIEWE